MVGQIAGFEVMKLYHLVGLFHCFGGKLCFHLIISSEFLRMR